MFHASLIVLWEKFEALAYFLLVIWVGVLAILRLWYVLSPQDQQEGFNFWAKFLKFFCYAAAIIIFISIVIKQWCLTSFYLFVVFFIIVLIIEFSVLKSAENMNFKLFWISLGFFILALIFWCLDWKICPLKGLWIIQFHALWHIFLAISIKYLLFHFLKNNVLDNDEDLDLDLLKKS
ncbi:hypothetical protein GEMRC1_011060 [Eukaryota sp. GEM-RC1]